MSDLLLNAGRRIRELETERDAARRLAERRLQERESWAATAVEHARAADRLGAENARLREANEALAAMLKPAE